MPQSSFFAKSVPFEQIDKLAISGGYSSIFASSKPAVPVVGNWEQRFCRLADTFQPVLDRVYDFEVREDDVWIVTLPKCGTTWMQELAWLVVNKCDFETSQSKGKQNKRSFPAQKLSFGGPNKESLLVFSLTARSIHAAQKWCRIWTQTSPVMR